MALNTRIHRSPIMRKPGNIHFSWVVVGILAMVQVIGSSIGMAAGIVVTPLSDADGGFGWSIGTIGLALMVYYLVGAAFSPVSGWLGDRYGARKMMIGAGLLYMVSMLTLGKIQEPWHFFVAFSVMLSLTQSVSMVPLMSAISKWFRRRLGFGVGILWAAGGVGTAIIAPLIGYLLGEVGWQMTFWSIGLTGGSILLLLSVFFRNRPEEKGIKPYGARDDDPLEAIYSKTMERLRVKEFNQQVRRTAVFWNLPTIHGLGCAGHGIILIYAISIAVEQGITLLAAAGILSLMSMSSVVSRFMTPVLADKFGGKPAMMNALFLQGVTVLVLFWAQDLWMFYLFAVLFGLGLGGEMSAYLVVNRQYFGTGPMSTTYGFQTMGALIGHAAATGLAGLVIWMTNSFQPILVLSMAFSLVGVVFIASLAPTNKVLVPDWEEALPEEARSRNLQPAPVGDD